jgi:hypothetical protein
LNTRRQANREHQANRHENKLETEERKEKEGVERSLGAIYVHCISSSLLGETWTLTKEEIKHDVIPSSTKTV